MSPQRLGNPSHQRVTVEKSHYEAQRVAFTCPLSIHHVPAHPSKGGSDDESEGEKYTLGLPSPPPTYPGINPYDAPAQPPSAEPMNQLSKEGALSFCLKDSIIYGNYNDAEGASSSLGLLQSREQDRLSLLDAVYRSWFPHRALAQDMQVGNFWGKYLRFQTAPVRLAQILSFHRRLCETLKSALAADNDNVNVSDAPALRKTLPLVFVVLERGWREDGVLLVWKTEGVAKRYGCWEAEGMRKFVCGDGSQMGPARAFRCSLDRAMRAVVELDAERAKERSEWSVVCARVLGGGS